jgi:hypothetical protein
MYFEALVDAIKNIKGIEVNKLICINALSLQKVDNFDIPGN